jgi:hypothetical protein
VQLEDVVEERTRGVGVVGDVLAAAGELVDQPRVDGAEADLTVLGPIAQALDVVQ